jgi:hypothetical protein
VTRCHLCQEPGRAWCSDTIGCNFRARLRLGLPPWQAKRLRAAEIAQRRERSQGQAS